VFNGHYQPEFDQQCAPAGLLARRNTFTFTFNRTSSKINGFTASAASVRPIKLIRKYLFFFTALGTFADNYLEVLKICIPGTMLWS
jgi:hypothetical protein